jgi:CDP-glucose 4,6-dehydratase
LESLVIDHEFWHGRKVFLTGHTGFKGSWLSIWLAHLGAKVTGYALPPPTAPALFDVAAVESILEKHIEGDVRDAASLATAMRVAEPDVVIHMAAQSLVQQSYRDPVETYSTNIMGTVNVLEAIRNTPSVVAALNVTSDKCYENLERIGGYRENEAIGGHDPYSSSKGCAELVSAAYRNSFLREKNCALATARAGNVIGGGDWAMNRIVPDAVRALMADERFLVRSPHACRPWQHVLDCLCGYLELCQQLFVHEEHFAEPWNFGPDKADAVTVSDFADVFVENWGSKAQWCTDSSKLHHEAQNLMLDSSKSLERLQWEPIWKLNRTISETVQWYKSWLNEENMHYRTVSQIEVYQREYSNR